MDTYLFHFINQGLNSALLDTSMVFITHNHLIVFLALLIPLFIQDWKKGLLALSLCVTGVIIASISVSLLKLLFARPRPCHSLEHVRLLVTCLEDNSLPSGHAATSFTVAGILGRFIKPVKIPAFVVASFVAYSRIYTGVHYPSDVIAGAVWGGVAAGAVLILQKYVKK